MNKFINKFINQVRYTSKMLSMRYPTHSVYGHGAPTVHRKKRKCSILLTIIFCYFESSLNCIVIKAHENKTKIFFSPSIEIRLVFEKKRTLLNL